MKKVLYLITIVTILQCCKNDETPTPVNGSVSFSFNASTSKTGRANEAAVPAFALVSIEDLKGTPIESSKKIALTAFGNGYVSEQLQLKQGDYKLTLFIITDSNGKAIYASPLTGSALADKVEHPLPLTFTVGQAQATIIPEVIAVEDDVTPDAFGYVNFGFEIVQVKIPHLKAVVMSPTSKIVYSYVGDKISKVEDYSFENNQWTIKLIYNLYYDANNRLLKKEYYQSGLLFYTRVYTYDANNNLEHSYCKAFGNKDFFYTDGKISEVHVTPGRLSNSEKVNITYNDNNDVKQITIHGYDSSNEEIWVTTEKYTYDDKHSITSDNDPDLFIRLTYILPHLNNLTGIFLKHNITSLETSTYWLADDYSKYPPSVLVVHSDYEYNSYGLPTKETEINESGVLYFNPGTTVKEFVYE